MPRRLYRPRRKLYKPRGLPKLVRTPLLANVLDTYIFGNAGPPLNLTGFPGKATQLNAPGYRTTAYGHGGYGTAAKYFRLPLSSFATSGSIGWTFRIVGVPISWPGGFTEWLGSVSRNISLFADTSGVYSFAGFAGAVPTGLTLPANKLFDLVVAGYPNSPFTATYYLNGALAVNTNWTTTASEDIYLGVNVSGGGSDPDMVYFLVQTWGRALSANDVAAAYDNLWQFVEWPEDLVGRPLVGTTGSTASGVAAWSGTAAFTGVGASTVAAVGAWSGSSTVTGVGASTIAGVAAWSGSSTFTAVGASTVAGVGAWSGTAAFTATGASTKASVAAWSGTSTFTGVGAGAVSGVQSAVAFWAGRSAFTAVGVAATSPLFAGWFVDRAVGRGKPVYSSGSIIVPTNGLVGVGSVSAGTAPTFGVSSTAALTKATLLDGWFVDRAPGAGKPVYSSGSTVVSTNGIVGAGVAGPDVIDGLPPSGDTIPTGPTAVSPISGLTRAGMFLSLTLAVGFDGFTMLYNLPHPAASKSWSMSVWVNYATSAVLGFIPNSSQGVFFGSNFGDGYGLYGLEFAPAILDGAVDQGPGITSNANLMDNVITGSTMTFPSSLVDGGWVHLMASAKVDAPGSFVHYQLWKNEQQIIDVDVIQNGASGPYAFNQADDAGGATLTPAWMAANIGGVYLQGGATTPTDVTPGGDGLYCAMAECWIAEGQYVDWTIAGNRAKFHVTDEFAIDFAPCNLGKTGKLPTGTKPTVYLRGQRTVFPNNLANSSIPLTVWGALIDVNDPLVY